MGDKWWRCMVVVKCNWNPLSYRCHLDHIADLYGGDGRVIGGGDVCW